MPVFACDSGEACQTQFSAESSLSQGEAFAKMTRAYHGGYRASRRTRRSGRKAMRGGAMLEMADYATAFDALPASMHEQAGVASLDAAIGDLAQFSGSGTSAAAGAVASAPAPQMGGKRSKRSTRKRGGMSPIDAPSMLLRPEDEPAAFLNPQWYDENVVNPNFKAPNSPYADSQKGGLRSARKSRKSHRKSHKSRKASKKSRKVMKGGKAKKSLRNRKASKKTLRNRKASKKAHRKH